MIVTRIGKVITERRRGSFDKDRKVIPTRKRDEEKNTTREARRQGEDNYDKEKCSDIEKIK